MKTNQIEMKTNQIDVTQDDGHTHTYEPEKATRVDPMGESLDSRTAAGNEATPATLTPHSPLPWKYAGQRWFASAEGRQLGCVHPGSRVETSQSDPTFTRTVPIRSEADAERDARFIVMAVNSHADLLDALRAFCGDHEATGFECAGLNAAYRHAMSVIAKATHEP